MPLVRELGHLYHESLMLQYLGQVLRRQGRPLEARGQLRVSLSISRAQRLQGLVCDAIALLAGVCLDMGQPYRAGVLLQVSERLRVVALTGPMTMDLPSIRAGVRAALADDDWHAARAEGDRLQPEDVLA